MANFVFSGNAEDLSYAAGIIDGEGSIGITEVSHQWVPGDRNQRRKSPSIRGYLAVVMSDPQVPVWLAETFGGTVHYYPPRAPNQRGSHHWRVSSSRAAEILALVVDRLKVKRQQAELVIEYYGAFEFRQRQSIPEPEIAARREYVVHAKALNKGDGHR